MMASVATQEEEIVAVRALTKRPGGSYEVFVLRAASDEIGRAFKQEGMSDNSDLSRIPRPTEADFQRLRRYQRVIRTIREA